MTPSTPSTHTVELELPLGVADELAAKAGSVDAAVIQALQDYLQTDPAHRATRDKAIRRLVENNKPVEQVASYFGMTVEAIRTITN